MRVEHLVNVVLPVLVPCCVPLVRACDPSLVPHEHSQVIRGRVRRLEADLTSSRRLAEERGAEVTRLQRSLDAASALSAERLEAIDRLEDDLATASQAKSSGVAGGGAGAGAGGGGGTPKASGGGGRGEGSNALRELLGVAEGEAGGGGDGGGGGGGEVDGHGVLGIVQVCVPFSWGLRHLWSTFFVSLRLSMMLPSPSMLRGWEVRYFLTRFPCLFKASLLAGFGVFRYRYVVASPCGIRGQVILFSRLNTGTTSCVNVFPAPSPPLSFPLCRIFLLLRMYGISNTMVHLLIIFLFAKAQRDRFRRRIKELEAEREDEQREARGARGVMESLQKDNLQLYEKVGLFPVYMKKPCFWFVAEHALIPTKIAAISADLSYLVKGVCNPGPQHQTHQYLPCCAVFRFFVCDAGTVSPELSKRCDSRRSEQRSDRDVRRLGGRKRGARWRRWGRTGECLFRIGPVG